MLQMARRGEKFRHRSEKTLSPSLRTMRDPARGKTKLHKNEYLQVKLQMQPLRGVGSSIEARKCGVLESREQTQRRSVLGVVTRVPERALALAEGVAAGLLGVVVPYARGQPAKDEPVDPCPIPESVLSLIVLNIAGSGRLALAISGIENGSDEGGELIEEAAEIRSRLHRAEVLALLGRLLEVLERPHRDHRPSEAVTGESVDGDRAFVRLRVAVQDAIANRGRER